MTRERRWPLHGWMLACVGWVVGVALQLQQAQLWPALWYGLGGLGAGVVGGVMWWGWHPGTRLKNLLAQALVCMVAVVLAFSTVGLRSVDRLQSALDPALESVDVRITGVVSQMPQSLPDGWRFRFEVHTASVQQQAVSIPSTLWLSWWNQSEGLGAGAGGGALSGRVALQAGQQWALTVRLKRVHGSFNPHGFDYELWMWERGLLASGYVRTSKNMAPDEMPQLLQHTHQYPLEQARQHVKNAMWTRLQHSVSMTPDTPNATGTGGVLGVMVALVTGEQRAIEAADWEVFRRTGVAHLMSISGLHITMLAWLVGMGLSGLWRQGTRFPHTVWARLCLICPAPDVGRWGGLWAAGSYALFTGWGVPAQRTVIMLGVAVLLRMGARRWPGWMVWIFSAAVVLAWDPWAFLQPGFWLSFVAVGILFMTNPHVLPVKKDGKDSNADPGSDCAQTKTRTRSRIGVYWSFMHTKITHLMREQGMLTLALAPLSVLFFGQVSLVGFLANLVAIPCITLLVTPLALAGVFFEFLWLVAAWVLQGVLWYLQYLSQWEAAVWMQAMAPWWVGALGVGAGGLLCLQLPWQWRLCGVPLFLPMLFWQPLRPAAGEFDILGADVGQGNAVLVRTAQHTLLYDAGPSYGREADAGQRVLVPLLQARGERLHRMVLSHRDTDHTGGALAVLKAHAHADLYSSLEPEHALWMQRSGQQCRHGQRWVWDGVVFEMLYPMTYEPERGKQGKTVAVQPNTLSCVLKITSGQGAVALLVGDIEVAQEQALVQHTQAQGVSLRTDFLLVPHHGSRTSSSTVFLQATQPRVALVQAGYKNRYGHPMPEVWQRYRDAGALIKNSVTCGAATWKSTQPQHLACERELRRRYWHFQGRAQDDET